MAKAGLSGSMIEPLLDALNEGIPMIQFQVEKPYYVETFGKYYVGVVSEVTGTEVVLTKAAWVADTGKFSEFIKKGETHNMEVEPVGTVTVPLAYISARYDWPHKLFDKTI